MTTDAYATYGAQAVANGCGDHESVADQAVDTIANVLHWATDENPELMAADILDMALTHWTAEHA